MMDCLFFIFRIFTPPAGTSWIVKMFYAQMWDLIVVFFYFDSRLFPHFDPQKSPGRHQGPEQRPHGDFYNRWQKQRLKYLSLLMNKFLTSHSTQHSAFNSVSWMEDRRELTLYSSLHFNIQTLIFKAGNVIIVGVRTMCHLSSFCQTNVACLLDDPHLTKYKLSNLPVCAYLCH